VFLDLELAFFQGGTQNQRKKVLALKTDCEEESLYRLIFKVQPGDLVVSRVARWCILKPKIQIWVNFGGP
jgi:hypothetical protein